MNAQALERFERICQVKSLEPLPGLRTSLRELSGMCTQICWIGARKTNETTLLFQKAK